MRSAAGQVEDTHLAPLVVATHGNGGEGEACFLRPPAKRPLSPRGPFPIFWFLQRLLILIAARTVGRSKGGCLRPFVLLTVTLAPRSEIRLFRCKR